MHRLTYPLLAALAVVPLIAAGIAFAVAPETLPMQVGFDGEVNRYGDKIELLLVGGIMFACNVLVCVCYVFADKLDAMGLLNGPGVGEQKVRIARIIMLVCLAFCDVVVIAVYVYLLSLA